MEPAGISCIIDGACANLKCEQVTPNFRSYSNLQVKLIEDESASSDDCHRSRSEHVLLCIIFSNERT